MRKPLRCWLGFHSLRFYLGTKWSRCERCEKMVLRTFPYGGERMNALERLAFPEQCEKDMAEAESLIGDTE